uniref:C-CAP/cofactor C-like domain-containing protein n=1 Tax=Aplanochytrium stocchinoi TaxID=215587 RepID=A0A7S3PS60_9STRA|mmetsp:Transcript_12028/g.14960  ORF Transcript_12028/g.14960 Transcript_12028/m.14960 type:complete len:166 (-) Transcript_12028:461-958(-)|eukprot:CAMPEP_0204829928 /NCGR_PEP_ID=MMETSP1346-20131115/8224_1 /ASSEMBLY_ACC=CAM_ASM_000771 /TAXON_ID=215587 /ORGANISM="Aplanochytrium stocchinoi, Strain GSBS06" /LENGTH=165 /DNA_ID=CAMNT_0051960023 /DNA_START=190 /DNA_END=687 /DNA_ORIENTATION=-
MSAKKQGNRWNLSGVKGKKGDMMMATVEVKDKKESAYLMDNQFANIFVKNKTSSVALDGCKNCTVTVDEVIATVEVTNCKDITIIVNKQCPSVAIDKTDSCNIDLTKVADPASVDVIAAKSSAMNIQFTHNGVTVEKPLPEQFKYRLDLSGNAKVITEVSDIYSA